MLCTLPTVKPCTYIQCTYMYIMYIAFHCSEQADLRAEYIQCMCKALQIFLRDSQQLYILRGEFIVFPWLQWVDVETDSV